MMKIFNWIMYRKQMFDYKRMSPDKWIEKYVGGLKPMKKERTFFKMEKKEICLAAIAILLWSRVFLQVLGAM